LIVFTGDNGTARSSIARVKNGKLQRDAVVSELGDRKIRGGKGSFTDAGTRVPLIANWKGMVEPGSTSDILIDMTDFLPTFADLAGGAPPSDVTYPGKSFAFELRGEEGEGRHWVRAESRGKGWVRTHDYKRYDDGRLVDVRVDWKETPAGESAAANKARDLLEQAQKSINVKP